jgi:hypothetical protein
MLEWIKSSGPLAAAIVAVIAMLSLATYASHERQQRERPEYAQQHEPVAESASSLAAGVNPDGHPENDPSASGEHEDATPWIQRFFSEINIADSIIAFFTVVLAGSTVGLWNETKRLAKHADAQSGDLKRSIKAAEDSAAAMIIQAQESVKQTKAIIQAERGHLVFDGMSRGRGLQLWGHD